MPTHRATERTKEEDRPQLPHETRDRTPRSRRAPTTLLARWPRPTWALFLGTQLPTSPVQTERRVSTAPPAHRPKAATWCSSTPPPQEGKRDFPLVASRWCLRAVVFRALWSSDFQIRDVQSCMYLRHS